MVVIMTFDGIKRTYKCESKMDAIVLCDALMRGIPSARIELWGESGIECYYSPTLNCVLDLT